MQPETSIRLDVAHIQGTSAGTLNQRSRVYAPFQSHFPCSFQTELITVKAYWGTFPQAIPIRDRLSHQLAGKISDPRRCHQLVRWLVIITFLAFVSLIIDRFRWRTDSGTPTFSWCDVISICVLLTFHSLVLSENVLPTRIVTTLLVVGNG